MKMFGTTKTALGALRRNVLRTMLTTLGIVIGVAAVITMMEIGNGATIAIRRTMASIGANTLVVVPGAANTSGINFGAGSMMTLTPQDADAIGRECPALGSVAPIVRVLSGETDGWVHALRRVDREGLDVLLIVNQNTNQTARLLSLKVPGVKGAPQIWDAMRNEITAVPWRQEADCVLFDLTLEPSESVLVRFGGKGTHPPRLRASLSPLTAFDVSLDASAAPVVYPVPEKGQKSPCAGVAFQGEMVIPEWALKPSLHLYLVCEMAAGAAEDAAAVRVNGAYVGGFIGKPWRVEITRVLKCGRNTVRIEPFAVEKVRIEVY